MHRFAIPLSLLAACDEIQTPLSAADPNSSSRCDSDPETIEDLVVSGAKAGGVSIAVGDVTSARLPDGRSVATSPTTDGLGQVVYLSQRTDSLDAGLYLVVETYAGAEFKPLGYAGSTFTIEGDGDPRASTPLGDDLCAGAPDDLWDFCQDFVACAAHDLWC